MAVAMTVTLDCSCGATLGIEDASEIASEAVMARWLDAHREHQRSDEQWRDYWQSVHRRATT